MIYRNSSFKYKTIEDWEKMTKEDILLLLANGADINEYNETKSNKYINYPPLAMASIYSDDIEVILAILEANPTEKTFYWSPFIYSYRKKYIHNLELTGESYSSKRFLDNLLNDILKIYKKGVRVNSSEVENILNNYAPGEYHNYVITFCRKNLGEAINEDYVLSKVSRNPLQEEKILKMYQINIPREKILLTKLQSLHMNEIRNSNEWYKMIDEIKKLKVKSGILGMTKEEFIMQNGAPDKEYKVNQNTTILTYIREERKNIPAFSNTSSISFNNGSFNNGLWNGVSWTNMGMGNSITTTSGGYVKTDRWEDMVFIDKGIVTGVSRRDIISTK